jgi:carbohydrate kinase (thermoresistant glucokinase family)
MPRVIGLRSPHARVGRIVIFGRMLDKIRLCSRGALAPEYQANLGDGKPNLFDGRCCRFLGVPYGDIRSRALEGGCDEEILRWAEERGPARNDEDCVIWNRFISKLGWRDDRSTALAESITRYGLGGPGPQTICELLDQDEGRALGATRSWEVEPISVIVVMGVAGCGKSTVGEGLSKALGWEFIEADTLHPASNIAKMSSGVPLDDADRAPWLASVREAIDSSLGRGTRAVVACSALRESYREVLAPDPADTRFIHPHGDFDVIRDRLSRRTGHFMGEDMLRSQFEALETPLGSLSLDVRLQPSVLISRIREVLRV